MKHNTPATGLMPFGYIPSETNPITYQIGGHGPMAVSMDDYEGGGSAQAAEDLHSTPVGGFQVWPNGANNDDPTVCKELIKGNRLLPSVLEKQIAILYGRGPQLYVESVNEGGEITRRYVKDAEIQAWLDSWQENGIKDDYVTYLNECIRSFYYTEGIFTKFRISAGARAGIRSFVPVAGLEHVSVTRARFCTRRDISRRRDITIHDFDFVMVANWSNNSAGQEYKVYPRLNRTAPLSKNAAISYSRNPNFGDDVYASNVFFAGVKEWIRGVNATPAYINSFLENSLSARHHVIIPNAWINAKQRWIQQLCDENAERKAAGKEYKKIRMGKGDAWTIEVGETYSDEILERYVQLELKKLTEFLSGRGKNQGKVYSSRAFMNDNGQAEEWKIVEIEQSYKEYIEALISYDKRADMVLLAAKGIDPSISNITPDGTVSKSGSDTLYNYLIYLNQQSIAEQVGGADINYALKLNFPAKYDAGFRMGFYRPVVHRQEDTPPSQRMSSQTEQ